MIPPHAERSKALIWKTQPSWNLIYLPSEKQLFNSLLGVALNRATNTATGQWWVSQIGGPRRRYVWGPPHPIFKREQRKKMYRLNDGYAGKANLRGSKGWEKIPSPLNPAYTTPKWRWKAENTQSVALHKLIVTMEPTENKVPDNTCLCQNASKTSTVYSLRSNQYQFNQQDK